MEQREARSRVGSGVAVMYHYIRDRFTGSGIFGLTVKQFEDQVLWLKTHYEILHPATFLKWLDGHEALPARACILTFDDGLVEHYRYVFPILRRYGLAAFFFLTTAPLETGRIAIIHKVHLLRQAMGEGQFAEEFFRRLADFGWVPENEDWKNPLHAAYRWDTPGVGEVKLFISRIVPYPLLDEVITKLFRDVMGSDEEHVGSVYLSWDQVRELLEAGMIIGGHGHSHRMYSRLEPAEQEADIEACLSVLERRLGMPATTYAYPFGQASTFTDVTIKLLRSRGVTCAFANEAGAIGSDADLLALKRVDPKDLLIQSSLNVQEV